MNHDIGIVYSNISSGVKINAYTYTIIHVHTHIHVIYILEIFFLKCTDAINKMCAYPNLIYY